MMNIGLAFLYGVMYFLLGIVGMFSIMKPIIKKYDETLTFHYSQMPFPYILGLFALGSLSAYFTINTNDFVEALTFWRVFVPLLLAGIIFLSQFFLERIGQSLLIIACVALEVYLQPFGIGAPFPELSDIITRLILIAFISVFCIWSKIMNGVPHTYVIPHILMLVGICVLVLVKASPLYVCCCSLVLLGSLIAYMSLNFHAIKIELDPTSCAAVSFLVSHLLLLNLGEFSFSSCIIFTTLFWSELIVAIWQRYVLTHEQSLMENTNYYQAALKYDAHTLLVCLLKVGCVILFIAWFQLFAKNYYSLFIVSLLIGIWLNNSLGKQQEPQDLKDINREFIKNLKDNIDEAKKIINTYKKDE